jgi:hypothetical protein
VICVNAGLRNLSTMAINKNQELPMEEDKDQIPLIQRVLDNPFILLFLGVAFPSVLYLIWGIMEIITIPIAN